MKDFVKNVIIQTDIGENSTLVGIIRFSDVATLETYIGEFTNKVSALFTCRCRYSVSVSNSIPAMNGASFTKKSAENKTISIHQYNNNNNNNDNNNNNNINNINNYYYYFQIQLVSKAESILHDKMLTYTDLAINEADKMLTLQ